MPERRLRLPAWIRTATAGWSLFYVALLLLVLGVISAVAGAPSASYVLLPLAVVLSLVGGIWAIVHQPQQKNQESE